MSPRDPIEDMFRDNQHGLDEKPRDLIWDRIEERLEEKPVVRKKSNGWKYAVAASVFAGISLAVLYFMNPIEDPTKVESVVLMESTEMNEEKATEILDQLEAESTAIVTTKSHAPAPEIMEEEMKKPVLSQPKYKMEPLEEISSYDAPILSAPAAAQMEMESVKPMAKEKQDEVLVFRGESPSNKEGNYILRNSDMDDRRLGNMAEKSVLYDQILTDSIVVSQFYVTTSNINLEYKLISQTKDSLIFENDTVEYPSQLIFIQKNTNTKVVFKGNENHKNSQESKEIQKYVNENKDWLYNSIVIE